MHIYLLLSWLLPTLPSVVYRIFPQVHIPFSDPFSFRHRYYHKELLKMYMISKSQEKCTKGSILSYHIIPEMSLWNLWEINWERHEQPQQKQGRNILGVLSTKKLWLIVGQRGARNPLSIWCTLQIFKSKWQSWSKVCDEGQQNGSSGMKHNQGSALLTASFTIDLEEEKQKQFNCRMKRTTRVDAGWVN